MMLDAARTIGEIGPRAGVAVPALMVGVKDKDALVRAASAESLGRIGPVAGRATRMLGYALRDDAEDVRYGAARALGDIGPTAGAAVPYLLRALQGKDATLVKLSVAAPKIAISFAPAAKAPSRPFMLGTKTG